MKAHICGSLLFIIVFLFILLYLFLMDLGIGKEEKRLHCLVRAEFYFILAGFVLKEQNLKEQKWQNC